MTSTYINKARRAELINDGVDFYAQDPDAIAEFGGEDGIRSWLNSMGNVELVTLLKDYRVA
jgi:hypothetical protein